MRGDDWLKGVRPLYARVTGTTTGSGLVELVRLGRIEVSTSERGPWRDATPEEAEKLRPLLEERARRAS